MRPGTVHTITKGKQPALFFTKDEVMEALESTFPKVEGKRIVIKDLIVNSGCDLYTAIYENLNP